ncbi:acyltransferase [Cryobacterium tagatosivorans]|nr:DapH/DapD/GlmU-related protein [Cryobacterium tagatosivorans]
MVLRRLAVRENVAIGSGFHVGPGSVVWAPRSLTIGNDVYLGKNVTIEIDGEIGDGVLVANLVGIVGRTDHDQLDLGVSIRRSRWVGDHPGELSQRTIIGSDVWIGYGAIILSGVTIGDSSIVGSGAVVIGDIPANSVAVGNPARVIGQRFDPDELARHWDQLRASGHRLLSGRHGAAH